MRLPVMAPKDSANKRPGRSVTSAQSSAHGRSAARAN